jgi:polar amino acid transport system substrate-binding protein
VGRRTLPNAATIKNAMNCPAFAFLLTLAGTAAVAQIPGIASGPTLRAAYIGTNPTQATRDPATGELRGASVEVARELARRAGLAVEFLQAPDAGGVIEAVATGKADIGFVAYSPARRGTVEFSATYMIVQQTFIVPRTSRLTAVKDLDRPGIRAAGLKGESITLFMQRNWKQATIVETGGTMEEMHRLFAEGKIDAYGANRQRLDAITREFPTYRLLEDNLFGVPQTVIVPKGRQAVLGTLNAILTDLRHSGFIQAAIGRSGVVGTAPAPDGFGYGAVE